MNINPNYIFFLLPLPISLFISVLIFVFYTFYLSSKFLPLRNKALMSFPKEQITTEQMIQAEMLRQDPSYANFNAPSIFGKIFIISLIINIIIAGIIWYLSPVPIVMF